MAADSLRLLDPFVLPILVAIMMIGLFDAVRNLCLGRRRGRTIASAAIFAGLLIALSVLDLWVASLRSTNLLASGPVPEARQERYINVPIAQREKYSRSYATYIFVNYGVLASHFDALGQWRPFVPTQQEIADREVMLEYDLFLATTKGNAYTAGIITLLAGLVATFLGWRAARLQRLDTEG